MTLSTLTQSDKKDIAAQSFDAVNAMNVLFCGIVLFLHHQSYTIDFFEFLRTSGVVRWISQLAVGGFMFLSGYKLTLSKTNTPASIFIRNRLLRLYPPYLAVTLFLFAAITYVTRHEMDAQSSIMNLIIHILCLQTWFPDLFGINIFTVWFVSSIFTLYSFFLLTRKLIEYPVRFLAVLTLTSVIVLTIEKSSPNWDIQVFQRDMGSFFIFFGAGMLSARRINLTKMRRFVLIFIAIVAFAFFIALNTVLLIYTPFGSILQTVLPLIGCIPLLILGISSSRATHRQVNYKRIFSAISYSTYFIYLLHRPIWILMEKLWNTRSIWQWVYISIFGPILIFAFAYVGQKFYDKTVIQRYGVAASKDH